LGGLELGNEDSGPEPPCALENDYQPKGITRASPERNLGPVEVRPQ
jgi:hypothetical protein